MEAHGGRGFGWCLGSWVCVQGRGAWAPPREGRQVRGSGHMTLGASLYLWSICEMLGRNLCRWSTYSCSWDVEEMELQTPM